MRFERVGVFTYSIEPDTPAAKLSDHLPERIKKERRNRLMAVQQQNAFAWCEERIGTTMDILIDKAVDEVNNIWLGRFYADAPDVDASVFVTGESDKPLKAGDLVPCEIVSSKNYDLVAAATGPDSIMAFTSPSTSNWNVPNALSAARFVLAVAVCVLIEWRFLLVAVICFRDRRQHRLGGWLVGSQVSASDQTRPNLGPFCRQDHHLRCHDRAVCCSQLPHRSLDGDSRGRTGTAGHKPTRDGRGARRRFLSQTAWQVEDGGSMRCHRFRAHRVAISNRSELAALDERCTRLAGNCAHDRFRLGVCHVGSKEAVMTPIQTAAIFVVYLLFMAVVGGSIISWSAWIARLRNGTAPKPWVRSPQATIGFVDILATIVVLIASFFVIAVIWVPLTQATSIPSASSLEPGSASKSVPKVASVKKDPNERDFAFSSVMSTAQLLAVVAITFFVVLRSGCSYKKLGWRNDQLASDLYAGLQCFLMMTPPLLILSAILQQLTQVKYDHPVVEMIEKFPWLPGFAFWQACVVAPISEEFAFRVMLVGWFESMHFAREKVLAFLFGLKVREELGVEELAGKSEGLFEMMGVATVAAPAPQSTTLQEPYAPPVLGMEPATDPNVECLPSPVPLPWWPSIVSGTLFGLAHYSYGVSWVPLIVFGIIAGRLYQHRQSIVPVIFVHVLFNSMSLLMLSLGLLLPDSIPK